MWNLKNNKTPKLIDTTFSHRISWQLSAMRVGAGWWWGISKMSEGGQKVQAFSCRISH